MDLSVRQTYTYNNMYVYVHKINERIYFMQNDIIEKSLELYQKDLSNLCYCLCRNIYDAENLFQETSLKVMKNQDKYNKDMFFDKWLFAICANTLNSICE